MKQVRCPKCGYSWERRGKLLTIKCPNCGAQFKEEKR